MSDLINVGVVGCGYWGPNLARNLNSTSGCRLRTVCDVSEDRLEHMRRLYPGAAATTDYGEMLDSEDLDAVMLATAISQHYWMAKASLEAGKHTFVEKPLAASVRECEELIEIAERRELVLMVGHTFLYSPPVQKIKEIVDQGDIGEIQYISSRRLSLGLFQRDINVVWDLAPHDISIILYMMEDRPHTINCQGKANITARTEDITIMSLQFRKGCFATVQNSWLDPRKVREMTIVGSKRMIVYDDVQAHEKVKIFDARVETPPHYDTFADFQYAYHYGDMYVPRVPHVEPLQRECEHFVNCVRKRETPLTCGRKGLELVRILEASSESLRCNGAAVAVNGHEESGDLRVDVNGGAGDQVLAMR